MHTQIPSLLAGFLIGVEALTSPSTELPQRYFRLMEAELVKIEKQLATEGAADPKALKTSRLPGPCWLRPYCTPEITEPILVTVTAIS